MYQFKKIAVKVGSNVLTRDDGTLNITRLSALVDQIAALRKSGVSVVLISSGAVAAGRSEIKPDKKLDPVLARQLYASVGQAKLINRYYELFREHHIPCGQVLTMKENFGTRRHYLNQKYCMEAMLHNGILPIVNENDTVSVTELMFTDNDELSGLIAAMMDMDALVILSNVDGIYDGDPASDGAKVIREIREVTQEVFSYMRTGKSQFGRGGMITKSRIAKKVADEGIAVIIANGMRDNILPEVIKEQSEAICTRFIPSSKSISNVKKWIAHSEGFAKGMIYINEGARDALFQPKATSVLFVGVTRIEGDFEKDDIVKLLDESGCQIGVGCVGFSSDESRLRIGKRSGKPLIHYDYLCLGYERND